MKASLLRRPVGRSATGRPPTDIRRNSLECGLAGVGSLAIFAWWLSDAGGYFERVWMPGTVAIVAIGAYSAIGRRDTLRAPSGAARLGLLALAGYVAWSFASLLWADSPADAFEGSQRAFAYLAVFALFVLLPWNPRVLLTGLLAFVGVVTAAGVITLLRLATGVPVGDLFSDAQLMVPLGYHNAAAALATMAAVPAVMLAARRDLRPWLRPVLLAATTLLLGLAVLGQSRAWLYTLPVAALAAVALSPDRLRLALFAAPALGGVLLAAPDLLDVHRAGAGLSPGAAEPVMRPPIEVAVTTLGLVCAGVLVAGAGLIAGERRLERRVTRDARRRIARALVIAILAGGSTGMLFATDGDPIGWTHRAWAQFKDINSDGGGDPNHLAQLGSGRYDVWRVGVKAWSERPLIGLGQDNFVNTYAQLRRSVFEEPRWVHSLPLRLLVHTGLVGAALFALFVLAVAFAAARAWRSASLREEAATAGAALLVPIVWAAHGSVDWLWEFPALSAAAFAFAGSVAALGGRSTATPRTSSPRPRRARRAIVVGAIASVLATAGMIGPSLAADTLTALATRDWREDPSLAFERLRQARALNPLSAQPWLAEGDIAVQLDELARARAAFSKAADLDPQAWFPRLALGLVTGQAGDRAEARTRLREAHRLNPRDPVIGDALRRVDGTAPLGYASAKGSIAARLRERRNLP